MKTNKPIRTFSKNLELVNQRRKQIIDGAIRVFIRLGFDNASMSDIAEECEMSKGLLYHYIKTKDDVLYLVAKDQYDDEAKHLADRVAVIRAGQIVALGTPAQLIGSGGTTEIRYLEGGEQVVVETAEPTRVLHELTAEAVATGRELDHLEVRRPTLEDEYLDLVGEDAAESEEPA